MSKKESIQIVDCPRDAIQGIDKFIPTDRKLLYINQLAASGLLDFIDFGSFVSPKAVPQMEDTALLVDRIDKKESKLIAIIANVQGAVRAAPYQNIDYLGYPFSISETFQKRNANQSIEEAYQSVEKAKDVMAQAGKQELMVYISMAFGNPYRDVWHVDLVLKWIEKLRELGIYKFSLADTTAEATPGVVHDIFTATRHRFPDIELSLHLHSRVEDASLKVDAAHRAGCRIFEGAIMGYGGCPFAQDDLVGNIPTEILLRRFKQVKEGEVQHLMQGFQQLIQK